MIVFIVGATFHFNIVCSVITTAVFKKQAQEVGSVVDQTSVHQRLLCSVASAEARYKGFDINRETGTCFGILNSDNTEPQNADIYSRSTKATNAFTFLPQVCCFYLFIYLFVVYFVFPVQLRYLTLGFNFIGLLLLLFIYLFIFY